MRLRDRKIRTAQAGFSMIEVLIVVAIIMIISAMAAPNVITSLRQVKLRGASSSMINIFEQARMRAVRDNKGYMVRSAVAQGTTFWYIDLDGDAAMGVNEPQVALPQSVGMAVAPPSNASLNLTSPNSYMLPAQTGPAFNARGLPCYATPLLVSILITVTTVMQILSITSKTMVTAESYIWP